MTSAVKGADPHGSPGFGDSGRPAAPRLQPSLHDRVVTIAAPVAALGGPDGQIGPATSAPDGSSDVDGLFRHDVRLLRTLRVELVGARTDFSPPEPVAAARARFVAAVRGVGEPSADPVVVLERERRVRAGSGTPLLVETITLHNAAPQQLSVVLDVLADTDLAGMAGVKSGRVPALAPATCRPGAATWHGEAGTVELAVSHAEVDGREHPGQPEQVDGEPGRVRFRLLLAIPPRGTARVRLQLHLLRAALRSFLPTAPEHPAFAVPQVHADDERFSRLLEQSTADLTGLVLADPDEPRDQFLAAGVPWFLTLFGRDSLWAARMLLPLGTDLAAGTLRVLARRQGLVVDAETEEQPGKILHEVRGGDLELDAGMTLPPLYFGTIDATPLWVCLLHDAWRWGLAEAEVAALLPHLERALEWVVGPGDADGDGFIEYAPSQHGGLANQGWKDSGDSIQSAQGELADGPIALCEVQAYAHEALVHGADLLAAFGRDGGRWREAATRLRAAFRRAFWVEDGRGAYPAVALDRDKQPVRAVTSNLGHLLGTGLLDPAEEGLVAARLAGPDLDCGHGLRTLSAASAGFNPVGYHTGSVWPHDTAIAVHGLAAAGHARPAASLLRGIVEAAPAFDYRLPELFGSLPGAGRTRPVPYPAACRPQAWSAAAAVHLLTAVLGLRPDVPNGRLGLHPVAPSPVGAVSVRGLQVGGQPLALDLTAAGQVRLAGSVAGLEVLGLSG